MSQRYFLQVAPGLEHLLRAELKELGARRLEQLEGGVELEGTKKHLYRALLWSRLASGVWLTLAEGRAPNPNALFDRARRVPWGDLCTQGCHLSIRCVTRARGGQGASQAESVVRRAVETTLEAAGLPLPPEAPWAPPSSTAPWDPAAPVTQRLLVRLDGDLLTLRVDAGGGLLHKRGWRRADGPAPLRPTLASACLAALSWDPSEPLLDPMCGAGTFTIEAARAALSLPPRLTGALSAEGEAEGEAEGGGEEAGPFACQRWLTFDKALWAEELSAPRPWPWARGSAPPAGALASDLSARSLELTRDHLRAALVDISGAPLPEERRAPWAVSEEPIDAAARLPELLARLGAEGAPAGLVVVNPPYNIRVRGSSEEGGDAARDLISALGAHLPRGWRAGVLLPTDYPFKRPAALTCEPALRFSHGGLPVTLWRLARS